MSALLDIEGLGVDFRAAGGLFGLAQKRLKILDDISLTVAEGETLGIVGESGSGKTTLIRAAIGLTRKSAGAIRYRGQIVDSHRRGTLKRLRRESAMMFQDPVASLSPRQSIGKLITEPFIIHGIDVPDRRKAAEELLALVNLPAGFADRYPHEVSGGQARRVGVARALALRPRLVIADEPTAGLDVSVQGEVLNLMRRLKRQFALAYVMVTHNLAVIRHVADRTAVMYLGRVVEAAPTAQLFASPLHPYTATLIQAEPVPDPRRRRTDLAIKGEVPSLISRPSGCEFHTRCPFAQQRCREELPVLAGREGGRQIRCHYPLH